MLHLYYILTGRLKLSTRTIDFLLFWLPDSDHRRSFPIEVINLQNCCPDLNWVRGIIPMANKNRFLIQCEPQSDAGSSRFPQGCDLTFRRLHSKCEKSAFDVLTDRIFFANWRFRRCPNPCQKATLNWVKSTPQNHPPPYPAQYNYFPD